MYVKCKMQPDPQHSRGLTADRKMLETGNFQVFKSIYTPLSAPPACLPPARTVKTVTSVLNEKRRLCKQFSHNHRNKLVIDRGNWRVASVASSLVTILPQQSCKDTAARFTVGTTTYHSYNQGRIIVLLEEGRI